MKILQNKKLKAALLALITIVVLYLLWPHSTLAPTASQSSSVNQIPSRASFDKAKYPIDEASSIWAVVNKGRALPSTYVPNGLTTPNVPLRLSSASSEMQVRPEMAQALETMFTAAKSDRLKFRLTSGYRSYAVQVSVYGNYASSYGSASADTFSARPGHSEHQTGLAADVEPASQHCELDQCFGNTPEGKWLAANSYKFGLIIRYQKNTQNLTGYEYEPWHIRYVGKDLAAQLHKTGQTLEQFFDLKTFTSYPSNSFELK